MESMEELYKKYANRVYQYLLSMVHDRDIAEEVTQETFYQAVRSVNRFDGSCKIITWLCAIARNQLIVYQRKHVLTEPLEKQSEDEIISLLDQTDSQPSAEAEAFETLARVTIMKHLHLLKEPYREIIYMRSFGGMSFREIGEVFGKSENWARVSYFRGKEILRKELEANGIDV